MGTVPFSTGSSTLPDQAFDKFPAIKTHGYRFSKCALLQLELSGSAQGAYLRTGRLLGVDHFIENRKRKK